MYRWMTDLLELSVEGYQIAGLRPRIHDRKADMIGGGLTGILRDLSMMET